MFYVISWTGLLSKWETHPSNSHCGKNSTVLCDSLQASHTCVCNYRLQSRPGDTHTHTHLWVISTAVTSDLWVKVQTEVNLCLFLSVYIYLSTVKPRFIQTSSTFLTLSQFIRYSLENGNKIWQELRVKLFQNTFILIMSDNVDRKICNEFGWIAVSC